MGRCQETLLWIARKLGAFASACCRSLTGGNARRIYLALVLSLIIFSMGVRFRSYLLTRKVQAVLSGLAKVRVDQTTEQQLLETVPGLVKVGRYQQDGSTAERSYHVEISNLSEILRLESLPVYPFPPSKRWSYRPLVGDPQEKWDAMVWAQKAAYLLGWRFLGFVAWARVLDGRVSAIGYAIDPDAFFG